MMDISEQEARLAVTGFHSQWGAYVSEEILATDINRCLYRHILPHKSGKFYEFRWWDSVREPFEGRRIVAVQQVEKQVVEVEQWVVVEESHDGS